MKVAALDLGTNSFLCLIAEGDAAGIKKVLSDQVKVVRLGQGVDKSGAFNPEALARARECLTEFKREIDRVGADYVLAMATSAARDVKNAADLFKIGDELGIPIEIIPGSDEARITFCGATEGELSEDRNVIVIDVGGGSTEFILGNAKKIQFAKSLDIGAVRLTEKFISSHPVVENERRLVEAHIDAQLDTIIGPLSSHSFDKIIAVAGTPSALAAAMLGGFDSDKVHGFVLTQEKLKEWCDLFSRTSVQERINTYHFEPGRADVIFVGATILYRFLAKLKKPSMMVSIKGVRYGVALEALSRCS